MYWCKKKVRDRGERRRETNRSERLGERKEKTESEQRRVKEREREG